MNSFSIRARRFARRLREAEPDALRRAFSLVLVLALLAAGTTAVVAEFPWPAAALLCSAAAFVGALEWARSKQAKARFLSIERRYGFAPRGLRLRRVVILLAGLSLALGVAALVVLR